MFSDIEIWFIIVLFPFFSLLLAQILFLRRSSQGEEKALPHRYYIIVMMEFSLSTKKSQTKSTQGLILIGNA